MVFNLENRNFFTIRSVIIQLFTLLFFSIAAHAEIVDIKYRGIVPLDTFVCPTLKSSSFVNRICFDEQQSYLIVQLKNTYYNYCSVPKSIVDEWIDSPSLGRYYIQNIKLKSNNGIYDCRKHPAPQY